MNINQRQQVLDVLDLIDNQNVKEKLIENYPEVSDLTKVGIGNYNASELVHLISKMTIQLRNELEKGLKFFLPFTENFSNDFGTVNLHQDLNQILSYIQHKRFDKIEPILEKLIHYQIKNGFWDKSNVKSHSINQEELKKQKNAIEINQIALNKNIENYESLKNLIEEKTKEFNDFIIDKKEELSQVLNLFNNAKSYLNDITDIKSQIQNKETEINGILKSVNEKLESITIDISDYKNDFEIIKTDNTSLKKELDTKLFDASLQLEKAKEELVFIDSKKSQIEILTGMAADGALGSKFDQRQVKLDKALIFWKWAVPVVSLLTLTWVIIVFTYLSTHFKNEWFNILINIIKTSPMFILLGFVFSQYKKERNLQEEYAFKSAVAMTLTAYSEMLSKADTENNISRQQMLLKSIELVYNQPNIYTQRNIKTPNISSKDFNETLSTLTEAIKNIKN
ncbi:hypothetical protein ACSLMO_12645 [Flavobacterium columnare]|uniref:hypothetical protein n=1 Tax=Flavobacterium columnare TaxID=996 RepID=UPI0040340959